MAEDLGTTATIYDFDYKKQTYLTPNIDYYDDFDEDSAKVIPEKSPSLPVTSEVND